MGKKIKNKKGLVLGAALGSATGIALGLTPLLFQKFNKNEIINVVDFNASNIGLNNAKVKFKLDLEPHIDEVKKHFSENPKLNINVVEANTDRIVDTSVADFNIQDKSFSIDVKNLNPGKIYSFQIVDLKKVNFTFNIDKNSSYIITKPELSAINYNLKLRNAKLDFIFQDDEQILVNKLAKITVVKTSDPTNVINLEGKIVKQVKTVVETNAKYNEVYLSYELTNLERDTEYIVKEIIVDDQPIHFNNKVINEFRTTIPTTTGIELSKTSSTTSSYQGELILENYDLDVENKNVNILYSQIIKDELGNKVSYENPAILENQTIVKFKKTVNGKEVDFYKILLNFENLKEGTTYEITKIVPTNILDPENNVNVILPRSDENKWVFSATPVVSQIASNTTIEKSALITVKLKDDGIILNNRNSYIKYVKTSELNDPNAKVHISESDIIGNFSRFSLNDLSGLIEYTITEFGIVINENNTKVYSPIEFSNLFDENQKKFIPTLSNVIIDDILVERITESSANLKIKFAANQEFIVNRKAKMIFSPSGSVEEITTPTVNEQEVLITQTNDEIIANFNIKNLMGGTSYSILKVELEPDPTKNSAENNIKIDFSLNLDGSKRKFTTEPTIADMGYKSSDASATLWFALNNSFTSKNESFENKTLTFKYKEKDVQNAVEQSFSTVITSNFAIADLKNLQPNKTFIVTSVEVNGHETSLNPDNNLLEVSPLITPEKKEFFTTATSATIASINSTAQSQDSAQLVLTFDDNSKYLANETLVLRYRKIGSNTASNTFEAIIDQDGRATYNFSNLEIGTNYIIHSLVIKKSPTDPVNKPQPKIIYDAEKINESHKVFRTLNGVRSFDAQTFIEKEARVIVSLADASLEYANKQLKIVYKQEGTNDSITSSAVDIINGKAIFDLANLKKLKTYVIEEVKLVDQASETTITNINNSITENDKKFIVNAQSAKVVSISEVVNSRTKNSAKVQVQFEDEFLKENQFPVSVTYRLKGQKVNETPVNGTLDPNTGIYTFDFSNLKEGSVYYIVSFNSQKNVNAIDGTPILRKIAIDLNSINDENKEFSTKATVNSITVSTAEEEKAKVYVRLNDASLSLANKELEISARKVADANNGAAITYKARATSASGLYIFDLVDLPKTEQLEIVEIKTVDTSENIDFGSEKLTEINQNKVFTVLAKTASIGQIAYSAIDKTSATVAITFIDKDSYVNNKSIKLLYRGQTDQSILKSNDPAVAINNKSASFNLTNLNPGERYEIVGFEFSDPIDLHLKDEVKVDLAQRTFVTSSVVNKYQSIQTSETSYRVIVSIADVAKVKNGFYGKISYHNNANASVSISSQPVEIINGIAIFNLTNLVKSGTYTIEKFEISSDTNQTTFSTLEELPTAGTENGKNLKEFTLKSTSATVEAIRSTTTENSAVLTVELNENDSYAVNSTMTVELRKQGDANTTSSTTATINLTNNKPTAVLNFTNLEPGTVYNVHSIAINDVPKIIQSDSLTDFDKSVATTPNIASLVVSSINETDYRVIFILKDPLSGTSDSRTLDKKTVQITYYNNAQPDQLLTKEAIIDSSVATFDLTNLVKQAEYKITKLKYKDANANDDQYQELTFADTINDSHKSFVVIPRTALITDIEFNKINQDSFNVIVKLNKNNDGYLNTNNWKMALTYKNSDLADARTTNAVSSTSDANNVIYTFTLNKDTDNINYGTNTRILSLNASNDVHSDIAINVKFDPSINSDKKEYNNIPSVKTIRDSAPTNSQNEQQWNVSINLKDFSSITNNKQLKIKYYKADQQQTVLTSDAVNIDANLATITLNNLEKFADYKIQEVILVDNQQETTLPFESTIIDNHKTFKAIPVTAQISEITEKTSTSNSASFKLVFADVDKNYLTTYNKITLNYRQRGNSTILSKNATITQGNNNKLEASFSFTIGTDNFEQGNYEILSVNFENDDFITNVHNANNPHNVLFTFANNLSTVADRMFATSTTVKSITSNTSDTSANLLVRVIDNSQMYVGSRIAVVYATKAEPDTEYTNNEVTLETSVESGYSDAQVVLKSLNKLDSYIVKRILINSVEIPFDNQFDSNQKNFATTGTTATVTAITGNEQPTSISQATLTLTFDNADGFLKGTNRVTPNVGAKQLYLSYNSKQTGISSWSNVQSVVDSNGQTQITFNLTNLNPGDTYTISSLVTQTDKDNGTLNELLVSFADHLNLEFKTKASIGTISKEIINETNAKITMKIANSNRYFRAQSPAKVYYRKVNNGPEQSVDFTYGDSSSNIQNNEGQISVTLNNLIKDELYEITRVEINNQTVEFDSSITTDTKQFRTPLETLDVTINGTDLNASNSGLFKISNENPLEVNVNNGWSVQIEYVADGNVDPKRIASPIDINNQEASFSIDNLLGGTTYRITRVIYRKGQKTIEGTINASSNNKISTLPAISEITSFSNAESQATVTLTLKNNAVDNNIPVNSQLTIDASYQTLNGSKHTVYATGYLNSDNTVTFNFNNLIKGRDYTLGYMDRYDLVDFTPVAYEEKLENSINEYRKFRSIVTSTEIENVQFSNVQRNSARALITLKDEFVVDNQQAIILYKRVKTNEIFNTAPIAINNKKQLTVDFTNLVAGAKYEIIGGTIAPSSANIVIPQSISTVKTNSFTTEAEIISTSVEVIDDNNANVTLTISDENNSFSNNGRFSLKIREKDNPAAQEIIAQQVASVDVEEQPTFAFGGLKKFTSYVITELTYEENNVQKQVAFNQLFDAGNELEITKEFKTKATFANVNFTVQNFNNDVTTTSTKVAFQVTSDDIVFSKTKNVSLTYEKLNSQDQVVATITSPINTTVQENGLIEFFLTEISDQLEHGTKYRVKSVNDLSADNIKIQFRVNNANNAIFETKIKQPTVTSIIVDKTEYDSQSEAIYPYKTKFYFNFDDPKNALKWDEISSWTVSATLKKFKNSDTEKQIDSQNINISRKNSDNVLVVELKSDDVREFISRPIEFTINNLTYKESIMANNQTKVTVPTISQTNRGGKLVAEIKPEIFVESISTRFDGNDKQGITLKIYDPKKILKNSSGDKQGIVKNMYWTPNSARILPYPFSPTWEATQAFGAQINQWTQNQDGTTINNGEFITPTSTKATSNFKLKQPVRYDLASTDTFSVGYALDWKWMQVEQAGDDDYAYLTIFYEMGKDLNSSLDMGKYIGYNFKLKQDDLTNINNLVAILNWRVDSQNQNITDTTEGTTLLNHSLITYNYPQKVENDRTTLREAYTLTASASETQNGFTLLKVIKRDASWNESETSTIKNTTYRNYISLDSASFDTNTNELKFTYYIPDSIVASSVMSTHNGYAVLQDDEGTLYFIGDTNGDPVSLYPREENGKYTITFNVNSQAVPKDEHAPINKNLRIIGIWTQEPKSNSLQSNVTDGHVFTVLIHYDHYADVQKTIRLIK
ncbi:hypothetical protein [Mesomycoplasma lagogenitalium]|uniref:DUF1410 domain-containing protein n=1 Tax=Mesomycoplasma lagogenitalium TaxID=171286 RepID=A0ABY8LVI5_9BACT|nr:hypothetical protein [Mesomycoplasma lagogenitalium]WGI36281.1 hypothetical protein QEG99_02260 [Mesomycoplasma lagogenitalium]